MSIGNKYARTLRRSVGEYTYKREKERASETERYVDDMG